MTTTFMGTERRLFIFFCLFFSLVSYFLGAWNRAVITREGGIGVKNAELRAGSTVKNADDEYYFGPAENLVSSGELRRSPMVGNGSYFRRVPVYPAFLSAFIFLFGDHAPFWISIFQSLLFGLSVGLLFLVLRGWGVPVWWTGIAVSLYGFWPYTLFWSGFTITEAITPNLCIAFIYALQRIERRPEQWVRWTVAGGLFALLVYSRPYTALAVVPLLFLLYHHRNHLKSVLPALLIVPAIFASSWVIRNYLHTGEIVALEKAFHPQSLDRMKPEFRGMFNLAKCWGVKGSDFNLMHQPFYFATIGGDSSFNFPDEVLRHIPEEIRTFDENGLLTALMAHQQALTEQGKYYRSETPMPGEFLTSSMNAEGKYDQIISKLQSKSKWAYLVKPRMIYLWRLVMHSGSGHVFALHRPGVLPYIWKGTYLILHVLCYLMIVPALWLLRKNILLVSLLISAIMATLFFSCIHMEIEQRYMLPFIPILFVSLMMLLHTLWKKVRRE